MRLFRAALSVLLIAGACGACATGGTMKSDAELMQAAKNNAQYVRECEPGLRACLVLDQSTNRRWQRYRYSHLVSPVASNFYYVVGQDGRACIVDPYVASVIESRRDLRVGCDGWIVPRGGVSPISYQQQDTTWHYASPSGYHRVRFRLVRRDSLGHAHVFMEVAHSARELTAMVGELELDCNGYVRFPHNAVVDLRTHKIVLDDPVMKWARVEAGSVGDTVERTVCAAGT